MEHFIKLQGIFEEGYGIIAKKVMKDKNLNVISKSIYAYICSYSGKGNDAFPSQKLICSDLGISKDTLSKYVAQLKEFGYITVRQEKENGKFARNVYTINIIPCMISSDTVKTESDFFGYGEVDTNNNSYNNNNNINNNNVVCSTDNTPVEKEKLKAKIDEYKNLISKATGEEKAKIDLVLKPYVYMPILDQLLEKIKTSKYLLGEKEQKPSLRIFAYKNNEIIAGIYDDFEKKQTAETKKTKTRNFNPDNPYDTRTPEQIEKDRREQEEFERAIGIL